MNRVNFILKSVNGKILDVGYEHGSLHEKIKEKFEEKNIYGIDIIVNNPSSHYKKGTAEEIPFEKNFFDSVVAGELIEHLKKPELFAKESNRILKKNGVLILTTPNRKSFVNRVTKSYFTPIHFSLFTKEELQKLLQENGFQIEKFECFPYTQESSKGARHKSMYFFRKLLHYFLPQSLQEEMCIQARKV
ncbi:MAG: methyltransferase domain-containing protein [archaeon]|nr:methyltransferase domain-containing protein [archaeon]